jgi:hypothetical protein
LPIVDEAHGVGGWDGGGTQAGPCAPIHDAQTATSAVGKLGVVEGQGERGARGPRKVVGVGEICAEAASPLAVLSGTVEGSLHGGWSSGVRKNGSLGAHFSGNRFGSAGLSGSLRTGASG